MASPHDLTFTIMGAEITVDEMGIWAAGVVHFSSEHNQEDFAHDVAHAIFDGVVGKVRLAKVSEERAQWVKRHPPNHAGFYYCHICGGWVHESEAELDHIEPKSVLGGKDPDRDDNRRMSHIWPQFDAHGKKTCMGNRGKSSSKVTSKTLEIAPPDEAS